MKVNDLVICINAGELGKYGIHPKVGHIYKIASFSDQKRFGSFDEGFDLITVTNNHYPGACYFLKEHFKLAPKLAKKLYKIEEI